MAKGRVFFLNDVAVTKIFRTSGTLMILSLCLIVFVCSCAGMKRKYNRWIMRGMVVDVKGSSAYVRVGSEDGAFKGQELEVYRMGNGQAWMPPQSGSLIATRGRTLATPYYTKVYKGKIRIVRVVDDHFSEADIISGVVQVEDVSEVPLP